MAASPSRPPGRGSRKALFGLTDELRVCFRRGFWLALGFVWVLGAASAFAEPEYTDGIAAIVNKEVITLSELDEVLDDERKRLRARFSGEELDLHLRQKAYQVLNALIERKLQLQEARAKGFSVSEEEIQRAVQRAGLGGGLDDKVRKRVEDQLLLEKLRAFEVQRLVTVSDAEIVRYYHDHQDQFTAPPTYRLRQILWLFTPGGKDPQALEAEAERVYRMLQNGAEFAELAKRFSDGPEAGQGGALGLVRQDELLAPLARALSAMSPGEISPPITTSLGIHIVALDETIPGQPLPLDRVEQEIKARLFQERATAAFQQWLTELKQKAFIDIKLVEP